MSEVSDEKAKKFPLGKALVMLFLLGMVSLIYFSTLSGNDGKGEILGDKSGITGVPLRAPEVDAIKDDVKGMVDTAIGKSGTYIKDAAVRSVDTIRETIIINTLESVTNQIDRLPKEDRDKVKEYVCR